MSKNYKQLLLGMIEGKKYLSDKFDLATRNRSVEAKVYKKIPQSWIKVHFKTYPRLDRIALTKVIKCKKAFLVDVLKKRRSIRSFSGKSMSIDDLSCLLLYSSGITSPGLTIDSSRRSYPSAGARYPLEIYPLIINGSSDIRAGLYHYNVKDHCLEALLQDNLKDWLLETTGRFKPIIKASVVFIITGVLDRTRVKYGDRAYRYVLMEAGHLSQSLMLLATGHGMGSLAVGGYVDSKVTKLLNLELVKEVPLYMIAVGKYVKS